jgi:hypothetical protein
LAHLVRPERADQFVRAPAQVAGVPLPPGSSAIHFYYSDHERPRFVEFLLEGLRAGEVSILAVLPDGYDVVARHLEDVNLTAFYGGLRRVDLSGDPQRDAFFIADALADVRGPVRLLADFGAPRPPVAEFEASVTAATTGHDVIRITQYDGHSIPAPIAMEQLKRHTLAVFGNFLVQENAEKPVRGRAAASA